MNVAKSSLAALSCFLGIVLVSSGLSAQNLQVATNNAGGAGNNDSGNVETQTSPSTGCDTVNGSQFSLQPQLNAQPQNTESVDFLLNRVKSGVDLVVGAANESAFQSRFAPVPSQSVGQVFDAFYVHRTGANCKPDFEGTTNINFGPTDNPTVVADPARDAFFLAAEEITGAAIELVTRTTAATLLSSKACPKGTENFTSTANAACWPVQGTAAFNPNPDFSEVLLSSSIAVDPRTAGTGSGDVYVAAQLENVSNFPATSNIQLLACTNLTLNCGATPVVASRSDKFGTHPWIQVRADGVITISYWTLTKPFGTQPNPVDIRFVTCQPQGAPKTPVCSKPIVVAKNVITGFAPGDSNFLDSLFPKHANRLEADGTFTTFLVYDRCRSILSPGFIGEDPVCSKVDLLLTSSTDDGATWSTPEPVESAVGHQYFGNVRVDASTGITNIAYYSTQNDPFLQRAQIFLSQIPAGSTTVAPAIALTSASTDPNVGIQNFVGLPVKFGDRIGLAAAGTGTTGQSRIYVHYTWDNFFGTSNGTEQPNPSNTLVPFSY